MSDTKWVCCPKCDSEIEIELDLGNAQMNIEGDETITFTMTGECQNDIVTDEQTGEWEYCAHEVEVTVYYSESHVDIDYNEESI